MTRPNKPLQPTRATQPNGQREPAGARPARLSAGVRWQFESVA
jgi:hypothetical protein